MPGTCELSDSGLAGTANQGLVDALECQRRQREEIKPAGNVIGFFFLCYCFFLTPSYSCLS